MRRLTPFILSLATVALLGACNQTVIQTPSRSFDRPTDVALTCVQQDPATKTVNPRPLSDCQPDNITKLTISDSLGNVYPPTLYALVTNSTRGELALVDVAAERLIDLRPGVPGYGFVPIGSLPQHVRTSDDGCRAATVNADSCDLALVDLPALYNLPRKSAILDAGVSDAAVQPSMHSPLQDPQYGVNQVRRLKLVVGDAPSQHVLNVRPSWIEFEQKASGVHAYEQNGVPAECNGGQYRAWVALPACQVVAEVDLNDASGNAKLLQAIRLTKNGAAVMTPDELSNLNCPSECAGVVPPGQLSDGGSDSNANLDAGVRFNDTLPLPTTLAFDHETGSLGRLIIGDQVSGNLTIVPIGTDASNLGVLGTPRQLLLAESPLGVQVVRVSPRSLAGRFLYAVARDGTVRVVDLDREAECETNPDPREFYRGFLQGKAPPADPAPAAHSYGCFPLGDPLTPKRSSLAHSPGIVIPNSALPRDIAFVHLGVPEPPLDSNVISPPASPRQAVGDFAWIVGSDGRATLINIFDACPEPNISQGNAPNFTPACSLDNVSKSRETTFAYAGAPRPIEFERVAHRIRSGADRFIQPIACADVSGTPRIADENNPFEIVVNGVSIASQFGAIPVSDGVQLPELAHWLIGSNSILQGSIPMDPSKAASLCASNQVSSVTVYDNDHLQNQNWTLSWEGVLPGTARSFGAFDAVSQTLTDRGANFCNHGVQDGDTVLLTGCTSDGDCDFNQYCVRLSGTPTETTTGLCLSRNVDQSVTCAPLLRSVRRFRILRASQHVEAGNPSLSTASDQLSLGEVYEPEHAQLQPAIDGHGNTCTDDASCAAVTVRGPSLSSDSPDLLPTRCLMDADNIKRCLRACTPSRDSSVLEARCGAGFQCAPSLMGDNRCMRAPLNRDLVATCLSELTPYSIHAGNAFVVTGSTSGTLVTPNVDPDPTSGRCLPANVSELVQSRIPLGALPACANGTGVRLPAPSAGPKVCALSGDSLHVPSGQRDIHFENPYFSFELLIPTAADSQIPPNFYSLNFTLVGGGAPRVIGMGVDVAALDPAVVLVAPDQQTLFVVDGGRQTSAAGIRGQLLRLSSEAQVTDSSFQVR